MMFDTLWWAVFSKWQKPWQPRERGICSSFARAPAGPLSSLPGSTCCLPPTQTSLGWWQPQNVLGQNVNATRTVPDYVIGWWFSLNETPQNVFTLHASPTPIPASSTFYSFLNMRASHYPFSRETVSPPRERQGHVVGLGSGSGVQTWRVWIPALPWRCCVNVGKLLNFSVHSPGL